jgi:hypothetical protein
MGRSDFLFARPNFLGGVATSIDLGATLVQYNESSSPEEADLRALKNDWCVVGEDMVVAIASFEESMVEQEE